MNSETIEENKKTRQQAMVNWQQLVGSRKQLHAPEHNESAPKMPWKTNITEVYNGWDLNKNVIIIANITMILSYGFLPAVIFIDTFCARHSKHFDIVTFDQENELADYKGLWINSKELF